MALLVAVVASIGKRCAKEGHDYVNQKQFYKGSAQRRVRDAYIAERVAIDGGVCEVCGVELGKIAHHKIWRDDENCNDPEISLNLQLFAYECQTCHNREADPRKDTPAFQRKNAIERKLRILEESLAKKEKT